MVSAASFSCFNAQYLKSCAEDKETVSECYTSVNENLIQSWRFKTFAIIKRHKTTYLYLRAQQYTPQGRRQKR